jgi:hypothetical protein
MNLRSFAVFAATAIASLPIDARADEPAPTIWYGWQTLLADGASVGIAAAGAAAGSGAVALVGLGGYVAGAPIVHVAHGQGWRAALSLGGRLLLPIGVGAFAGAVTTPKPCDPHGFGPCLNQLDAPLTGALVGMVLASGLDAFLNAYEPAETQKPTVGMSLTPTIDVAHGAYGLALGGTL